MAGPWAGQLLADLGADVIKVERPGAGDDTRSWGPPFLKDTDGAETRESGYYLAVNRGKRSLTLSIEKPEGQAIVRQLAARSDILLENFKAGTLARYGLAYDDLKKINPRLIYCSVTGFGQDGPKASKVAYDFLIQAMGGLMSITGERDGRPGAGPQKVGIPILDLMTGMYASSAVLAGLAKREATGRGDYIDIAMLDVQTAVLGNQAMNFLLTGRTPQRQGNAHPNIVPQDVIPCRDGAVVLAVGNDGQYAKMCGVLGDTALSAERFVKNPDRIRHKDELMALIAKVFAQWTRAELVNALEKVGVPCGPINSIPEVFEDAQVKHRRMRIDLPHPSSGTVPLVKSPINFAEAPSVYERAPPLLGQHSDEILREIGLSDTQIAKLRANGVV
jgi:crotonobetainyl-CoA:carnitine CoA-transferase CaiB-like acyl-CoA transferase